MDLSASIRNLVAAALAKLGMPAPSNAIPTVLIRDGYFVGHKLRYDGGYAIWQVGGNTIELYDEQGKLLKIVAVKSGKGAAA
jgi:hypothetical protein